MIPEACAERFHGSKIIFLFFCHIFLEWLFWCDLAIPLKLIANKIVSKYVCIYRNGHGENCLDLGYLFNFTMYRTRS